VSAVVASEGTPALELNELSVSYDSGSDAPALAASTWCIAPGQWVALLGPNGSGKSSLMRTLATLCRPTSGDYRLFGIDPAASRGTLREARTKLGVIFQQPALDALLTVRENLAIAAAAYNLAHRAPRIEHAAAAVGLTDRLDHRVGTLSGGLVRRADLARALLPEPRLLLLDEPTTGLDLESRHRFLQTLHELHDQGMTILMATHQMDEAEQADRVVLMSRGRVMADGPPQELKARCSGLWLRLDAPASTVPPHHVPSAATRIDATPESLAELIASGVAFRFGPATLADAYLELTGQPLEPDA
jgi:ABC-type multidrug transport system ATPase subunit